MRNAECRDVQAAFVREEHMQERTEVVPLKVFVWQHDHGHARGVLHLLHAVPLAKLS